MHHHLHQPELVDASSQNDMTVVPSITHPLKHSRMCSGSSERGRLSHGQILRCYCMRYCIVKLQPLASALSTIRLREITATGVLRVDGIQCLGKAFFTWTEQDLIVGWRSEQNPHSTKRLVGQMVVHAHELQKWTGAMYESEYRVRRGSGLLHLSFICGIRAVPAQLCAPYDMRKS